jgi:metallo-beta-lactamase family protein
MAPHTLGRRLAEGKKTVRIFGQKHKVEARVVSINGLSSHADQDDLVAYALASKDRLRKVFLTHGEPRAAHALREKLISAGIGDVSYPGPGTTIML